jgi:hypothetical protein
VGPRGAPLGDPVAEADALHRRFNVREPAHLRVDLMAVELGWYVIYRNTGGADARVVRDGRAAFLSVSRAQRDTPRARFSMAHEMAHPLLHPDLDAIERIHAASTLTEAEREVERAADRFASHLLLPRWLLARFVDGAEPGLDGVGRVAREFGTSLSATLRAWTEVTDAPCAYVASRRGVITETERSASFRGVVRLGRRLRGTTAASAITRGELPMGERALRTHDVAWGSAEVPGGIVEESIGVPGAGVVVTWLRHAWITSSTPRSAR